MTPHSQTLWQQSHTLAVNLYEATYLFPCQDAEGLREDIRRCGMSIPLSLEAGNEENADHKAARLHRESALSAVRTLAYQLRVARDLHWLGDDVYEEFSTSLANIKTGLQRELNDTTSENNR